MPESDLLTIGAFARSCGLSASALRFYADAGVLVPALVDESTGYRYYAPEQAATARLIRHLRAVDMPLPTVAAVLAEPDPARALALVDAHLADLDRHLDAVRAAASAARAAFQALTRDTTFQADALRRSTPPSWESLQADPSGVEPGAEDHAKPSTDQASAKGFDRVARAPFVARGVDAAGVSRAESPGREHDPGMSASSDRWRGEEVVWVRGPHLAAAIDQIATATVADPNLPVLNSIHLESTATDLILTATDRYRLATRTLRPARPSSAPWTATIDADDLRDITSWLRREHTIALRPTSTHLACAAVETVDTELDRAVDRGSSAGSRALRGGGIRGSSGGSGAPRTGAGRGSDRLDDASRDPDERRADVLSGDRRGLNAVAGLPDATRRDPSGQLDDAATSVVPGPHPAGSSSRQCRRSTEPFPDYRAMLAALPAVTTRVVVPRAALLDVLERSGVPTIALHVEPTGAVRATFGSEIWQLPATATGPALTIHFAVTTLYPAVACSFGPDVLVDLSAADRPALLRAADDGTLLTLVMPRRAESAPPSVD
ncbi:MerR family transcriptional regulator [Nocardia neocaledoniensis]|uniref:DNA polymerase III subunit beta family protein n=1 Tax=Nocardia neocaledoniensis TaxID=236511 RepID=UPI002456B146|nr:MerR family transcriptional regulator [Nocardia neocaledoniensis]